MRLFFAIELPNDVREKIVGLQDEIRQSGSGDALRFVRAEQLHVTLAFLGEFPEEKMEELKEQAATICAKAAGSDLHFEGIGAFPNWRSPHVIWVGVRENGLKPHDKNGPLTSLGTLLTHEFAAPRESEEKVLLHVTLARANRRLSHGKAKELSSFLKAHPQSSYGQAAISEVILFQSTQTPAGSKHEVIARFALWDRKS